MRRAVTASLCLAILAACATTQDFVDQGRPLEYAAVSDAKAAARCAAHNVKSFPGPYTADWAEILRPGNYETVVRQVHSVLFSRDPIIVVRTRPADRGSQMQIYFSNAVGSADQADWIERLRRGC